MQVDTSDPDLRDEADRLLSSGLRRLLEAYGEPHVVGSYALHLMVWRDLDIHVVRPDVDVRAFFTLGAQIAELLSPPRMHFRNEIVGQTPGLPPGLYWGIYLGDERKGAWKIDIWSSDAAAFRSAYEFEERVRAALTDDARAAILHIKRAVWQHPEYRRGFSSGDVYKAVLDRNVRSVEEFFSYLASIRS